MTNKIEFDELTLLDAVKSRFREKAYFGEMFPTDIEAKRFAGRKLSKLVRLLAAGGNTIRNFNKHIKIIYRSDKHDKVVVGYARHYDLDGYGCNVVDFQVNYGDRKLHSTVRKALSAIGGDLSIIQEA